MMPSTTTILVSVVCAGLAFAVGWLTGWFQHRQQRREYRTTFELLFAILQRRPDMTRELSKRGAIVPRYDTAGKLAELTVIEGSAARFIAEQGASTDKTEQAYDRTLTKPGATVAT